MQKISKPRLVFGIIVFAVGMGSPLLIPLVTSTHWPVGVKATISGFLALGFPELMIVLSVAILGKQGYDLMKGKIFRFLKNFSPPDRVSKTRYYVGLLLFVVPVLLGWLAPYLNHYLDINRFFGMKMYIVGDIVFVASFFVLGGNFWEKFRSLFIYKATV